MTKYEYPELFENLDSDQRLEWRKQGPFMPEATTAIGSKISGRLRAGFDRRGRQDGALGGNLGDAFPPTDYWSEAERPQDLKYSTAGATDSPAQKWTACPPSTQRSWVCSSWKITEWSVDDVGAALMKYLSDAKTAEGVALRNLHAGVPPAEAAVVDNPFIHWIGADIRSDPWGYAAPGYPELAAEFAWRDATISHRRNGIYGAMYFSAVIAAAFALSDPLKALEAGLAEIPADCLMAREVRWALEVAGDINDFREARAAVDERYAGMHKVHTINVLTIWGLTVDYTKVIGETVAWTMTAPPPPPAASSERLMVKPPFPSIGQEFQQQGVFVHQRRGEIRPG